MSRIIGLLIFILPGLMYAQNEKSEVELLHAKIDKLSNMLDKLKAEKNRAWDIDKELRTPPQDFTTRDSLRLIDLRRKQVNSRARIDALTVDIIKLSKQLEDPKKRYALAKKIQQSSTKDSRKKKVNKSYSADLDSVSARSIDLAAVKLVRKGKSLDQARLLTIENLDDTQVQNFYRGLVKNERYKLYDIADDIILSEGANMTDARRSAIYFYLFAQR